MGTIQQTYNRALFLKWGVGKKKGEVCSWEEMDILSMCQGYFGHFAIYFINLTVKIGWTDGTVKNVCQTSIFKKNGC